ncbi:hypothetical protein [Ferrimonas sp. SCSIO 43195]|uniref:hypothetical protein n=1 Tax=Ferrimonas sp. SCSIO 43195 TaxID=2822844 RepID=UPI002075A330|nr:hypothetical protein [Ferrimonas sp. SCSIO 43195]USD38367.1 hypothetical protein J8Z22_04270 [Ferrimonas sp. SCSIO 43195]
MDDLPRYLFPAPGYQWAPLPWCLSLLVLLSLFWWPDNRLPAQILWQGLVAMLALALPLFKPKERPPGFALNELGQGVRLDNGEAIVVSSWSLVLPGAVMLVIGPDRRLWWLRRSQLDTTDWRRLCRIVLASRLRRPESE